MRYIILILCLLMSTPVFAEIPANTGVCLNAEETQLTVLVNEYRAQNGLQPIPVSYWVSTVGQWHVWDLMTNNPVGGACNIHSWSNAMPALWQGMCYTADHTQATQMWGKPFQISGGTFTGRGYENAAVSGVDIDAETALWLWKNSPSHNDVILNRNSWAGITYNAMGVGIYHNYAVLWFADGNTDPAGTMVQCQTNNIFMNGFE